MNYFITAIGTDSGKTLASAIICEALKADYWKPVQSGSPRDTDTVRKLITNKQTVFHPERFKLNTPVSPHASARLDGVHISLDSFELPETENVLIVEGAGGCLVPLNDEHVMIDLMARLNLEVIVVSNHYLGSINHTLLTVEALLHHNLRIKGLIFNGDTEEETERVIIGRTKLKCLLRIKKESYINSDVVRKYASLLKTTWND